MSERWFCPAYAPVSPLFILIKNKKHRSLFLPETVKRDPSRSPLERPGVRSVRRKAERLASPRCAPTVMVPWTNPRPRPSLMVVDRLPCAGAPASTRKPRIRLALQGWHSGPTLALACPTAPRPTTARAVRLRAISRASSRLAAHPWACMLPMTDPLVSAKNPGTRTAEARSQLLAPACRRACEAFPDDCRAGRRRARCVLRM